ncbi:HNH endonuclease signature motif containing protein [Microlunatus flavus]|uniref:HNH endonuclease n=1 Tax=Microlunatus flavus TaxID=1036181 RepID=A0A1H9MT36_9ACTN|nr:HNH endonuclease signature motif containing protein [Microlunatus flavus]SER26649.1 HNH endonuclease [Microlunatus flavus]
MDEGAASGLGQAPLGAALQAWSDAQDDVVRLLAEGALDAVDDLGLVEVLRRIEATRNRSALLDHHVVQTGEARRLADSLTQPSMAAVLVWALRLSRGEASRRVRAAAQLGERRSMTGELLPALRPSLAAAQAEGRATPEQIDICLRALDGLDHRGFDPHDLETAEQVVAGFAATFPPAELRGLAQQVVDRVDPDGTVPDDELHADRRHLELRRCRDHSWRLEGRLTPEVGAKLTAVLGPLAAPRVNRDVTADGRPVEDLDERHHGQRRHDALEEVCDRLLRSGTLPDSGGTPATVIVTIAEGDLAARRRWGVTSDGTMLSSRTLRRLADEAEVVPAVVSCTGVVLHLGRTRRLASAAQTLALVARDRGCSFPGCQRPPEWCERHHIRAWADGGRTDLDNLTLLCAYHHHHFEARGWTCRVTDGLPTWTPPRWIDPQQRPLRNVRISAAAASAGGKLTIRSRTRSTRVVGTGPPVLRR